MPEEMQTNSEFFFLRVIHQALVVFLRVLVNLRIVKFCQNQLNFRHFPNSTVCLYLKVSAIAIPSGVGDIYGIDT